MNPFAFVRTLVFSLAAALGAPLCVIPQGYVEHTSPDYLRVSEIYKQLVTAAGDLRRAAPDLEVNPGRKSVAMYHREEGKPPLITIDQEVIRICEFFGPLQDDALAYLLGHELAHFYNDHGNTLAGFVDRKAGYMNVEVQGRFGEELGQSLQPDLSEMFAIQNRKIAEAQADYYAGFYTTFAGYSSLKIAEQVLRRVIDVYAPDSTKHVEQFRGYPDLQSRIKIGARTRDQFVYQLLPLFEVSRYLIMAGKYEKAREVIEYLIGTSRFESSEMYNNLAGLQVLSALEKMRDDQTLSKWSYSYAVIFEENSVLNNLATKRARSARDRGADSTAIQLLNDAVSNLIRSRSLRPDFTPSLLNLATAYFLLGEKEMAGAYLSMASRRIAHESNERLMSMGDNLKGIMRACDSDSKARKEAEALFRKAMAISPYAASNLALLRTGKPEEAVGNQRFDRITVDGKQLIWRNQGSRLVKAGKLDLKVAEWDWVNGYQLGDFVVFVIGAASQLVCDGVPFKEGDALPGGASPIPATFSLHDYYTYNNLFLARGSTGKIESRIIINPTYD